MVDLALKNGISASCYYTRVRTGMSKKEAATKPAKYTGDYAVYRGDELLVVGSAEKCAEELGVSVKYIKWMTTPYGRKRTSSRKDPNKATTAIKLDEGDD